MRPPGGVPGVLHAVGGNDRGKQFQLLQQETTIGRGADQAVILADIAVSRRHVVIHMEGERYRLRDLGSGNGTLINGSRVDTVLLNDGDQIELGNSVLRFDHAPSRVAQAPAAPPVMMAPAENKTMMADAVNFPPPQPSFPPQQGFPQQQQPGFPPPPAFPPSQGFPPPPQQQPSPFDNIAMPAAQRPSQPSLPAPVHTGSHPSPGGLLDSPIKKLAVFGSIGLVVLLVGALVVKKFVLESGSAKAQKLFVQGQKAFTDQDYTTAKQLFSAAITADPEVPQANKYLKQCDVEIHARGALKTANSLAANKRWVEVLKSLDTIDKSSQAYKEADDLKKQAVPAAIEAYLAEAKDLMKDDPEAAQSKLDLALTLDPENEDALDLEKQLKEAKGATAEKGGKAPPEEKTPAEKPGKTTVAVAPTPRPKKPVDDDLAPVGKQPKGAAASAGNYDVLAGKGGAPYRSKDFVGAAQAVRSEARGNKGIEAIAAQVSQLGTTYFKAEGDKAKNVQAAVAEYQQAMALDAKVGKGYHASYFKGQLGKLEKQLAQQAFQQQKFDVAYEAAKNCAKFGSDDGGVLSQLKAKAAELNARAAGMKKSNINAAKSMWRMVVRMVPPGDPNFVKASQELNASQGSHTDEDE